MLSNFEIGIREMLRENRPKLSNHYTTLAKDVANIHVFPKYSCKEIFYYIRKGIELHDNNPSFCIRKSKDVGCKARGILQPMCKKKLDNCTIKHTNKDGTITHYKTYHYVTYKDGSSNATELACRNTAAYLLNHEPYLDIGYIAEFCDHLIKHCEHKKQQMILEY